MSGIAGIVNFEGAPVDRALLSRMTNSLEFRGPDGKHIWIRGAAGFGHTLLRTTDEAEHEEQPLTFDGRTWIVADARVDARRELVSQLQGHGRDAGLDRPDVELILHAYHVWGERCVEHLLGDFAIAIWDEQRRSLFCARDHMGAKPFYYAHIGSSVIFSNTLDCVRLHPRVSDRLNDLAIADHLLFDENLERDTTSFAGIQRLAAAHSAVWTDGGLQLRRYWTLPIDEPIHYPRLDDYTGRFNELLRNAVNDRIRTPRVGVFMSGGIDSSTLAATARDVLSERSGAQVRAFTWVFDGIDQERHYADMVAKHLDIPISFRDGNIEGIDPHWEQGGWHTPEPPGNPLILEQDFAYYQEVASHNRVVFYGEGPDAALQYEWQQYLRFLVGRREYRRLIQDVCSHVIAHRRVPLLPTIPRVIRERGIEKEWDNGFPIWLEPSFERRLNLRERWAENQFQSAPQHPTRPRGYAGVTGPQWPILFEDLDAANTRAPLEFRHPYFDIRLLRYLLRVPALPWCRMKYLIRRSMHGRLPEPVRRRPKAALYPDPWTVFTRRSGFQPIAATERLLDYVDPQRVPAGPPETLGDFRERMTPRRLNYWLKNIVEDHRYLVDNEKGDLKWMNPAIGL